MEDRMKTKITRQVTTEYTHSEILSSVLGRARIGTFKPNQKEDCKKLFSDYVKTKVQKWYGFNVKTIKFIQDGYGYLKRIEVRYNDGTKDSILIASLVAKARKELDNEPVVW